MNFVNNVKLYIVRHGETMWNTSHRLQGDKDIPLNQKGIRLAKITADSLRNVHLDLAYSSPLDRAATTCRIILADRDIKLMPDRRLSEICFGIYEGLCCDAAHYEIPDPDFSLFFSDPFAYQPAPGGESIHQICERTKSFYEWAIRTPAHEGKSILISTHGCATRALLHNVYKKDEPFWHGHVPPNCSVNLVEVNRGIPSLLWDDKIFYDPSLIVTYGEDDENK